MLIRLACLLLAATLLGAAPALHADPTDDFFEGVRLYRARQYADAAALFRKAAERGDGEAQFLLGRMHYDGNSISVDYIEAHKWFALAADSGITVAPRYRDGLAARMNPEDVQEARRRAERWRSEHPPADR